MEKSSKEDGNNDSLLGPLDMEETKQQSDILAYESNEDHYSNRLNYETQEQVSSNYTIGTWQDAKADEIEGYLVGSQRKFVKYRLNIFYLNKVSGEIVFSYLLCQNSAC